MGRGSARRWALSGAAVFGLVAVALLSGSVAAQPAMLVERLYVSEITATSALLNWTPTQFVNQTVTTQTVKIGVWNYPAYGCFNSGLPSSLTGYQIDNVTFHLSGSASQLQFTGLAPSTTYCVEYQANYSAGQTYLGAIDFTTLAPGGSAGGFLSAATSWASSPGNVFLLAATVAGAALSVVALLRAERAPRGRNR